MTTKPDAVLYIAPTKDIPLGARIRYPGAAEIYILLERHGYGLIAEWCDDMPRGWVSQGIYSVSGSPCADVEMEVLGQASYRGVARRKET